MAEHVDLEKELSEQEPVESMKSTQASIEVEGKNPEETSQEEPESDEANETDLKIKELTDRLLRTQAEFDNYRRRTQQEMSQRAEFTRGVLLEQLLPILDNFERALGVEADGESFRQGVDMIHRQLVETTEKQGLVKIEAKGQEFDPHFHEAVMREASEEYPEGIVLEELQCGYKLGEQVLRPAMVKVSS